MFLFESTAVKIIPVTKSIFNMTATNGSSFFVMCVLQRVLAMQTVTLSCQEYNNTWWWDFQILMDDAMFLGPKQCVIYMYVVGVPCGTRNINASRNNMRWNLQERAVMW